MKRTNKGSPWLAHELSVSGRVASHLPLPFQTQVAAQAYLDGSQYNTGDTFRLTNRDGGGSDTTITAA